MSDAWCNASLNTTAPTAEPTKEKATIKMNDCINLDQKVSTHTDNVVSGFRVEADENECESEDAFMSLDHCARLNGAIAFVCKDLLGGKSVTYFLSLSSRYGNYSESELREMRKDKWANQSVKYKLKWSEDGKKRWDDQSDEYK